MATHFSILARRIPMERGAWWATVMGSQKLNTTEQLDTHLSSQCEANVASFWLESVRWKCSIVHLALCVCVCDCVKEDLLGHRIRDALRLFQITTETEVLHLFKQPCLRKTPLPPTSFPSSQQIIPLLMLIFSSNFLQLSVPQERVWLV